MKRTWTPAQEAAITLRGQAILVSAAAGSGKTSVLTERIIRSLIDPDHPADLSRILVVTFTRAAAADLKAKIAEALTRALGEDPGNKHLSNQLLALGSAQISTIDSFFQKLVRANFEKLGLPATFRIADQSEVFPISLEIIGSLIEEFYEKYRENEQETASISTIRQNKFARILDHLMSDRSDGKLPFRLLDFLESFSSYPQGIQLLKQCATDLQTEASTDFLQSRYGAALTQYLEDLFISYKKDLEQHEKNLSADPDVALKCSALLSYDQQFCNAILQALQEGAYVRLQSVAYSFTAGRFPTIHNKPTSVESYQAWRTAFRKAITEKLQAMLQWPPDVIADQMRETASVCEVLYQFYTEYTSRLLSEKNERGILEHNDVRALLYRLLSSEDGAPTEFAASLSAQYDAVYIDEYQDVDLLQDRIFALIGGNKRFMVGDIKQSIYGFRGSDPSIFAAYRRNMPLYTEADLPSENGVSVFMSNNFRCNQPVIDFANRICRFLFSACERSVGYRKQDDLVYSKSPPKKDENSPQTPVQVAVFDPSSKVLEAETAEESTEGSAEAVWVASEISHLLREERLDGQAPILPSDIAILVQKRAHAAAFVKELKALEIPVVSETSADLLHEPLLTDVLNYLRAIDNPYRDLPLTEFLLSPLGGFTLEELSQIRASSPTTRALFDAMVDAEHTELTPSLIEKTIAMLSRLEKCRKNASILPADRFLHLLYLEEALIEHANTPSLLFLYDQARIYQKNSFCGLYGFLQHIDKLLDSQKISAGGFAKAENAVTVMTVHHSKGLEFSVVFLVGCGSGFNRTDTYESLLYRHGTGCASKLYDPWRNEHQNTALREIVRREIDGEQTEESIRTLYVALTRAKERMYITGTLRGKWENACTTAKSVRYGNRAAILSSNSYLSWILAALLQENAESYEEYCVFRHITTDAVQKGIPLTKTDSQQSLTVTEHASSLAVHYAAVLQRHAVTAYPSDILQGLPTKAAASKIRRDLTDRLLDTQSDVAAIEAQIALMQDTSPTFDMLLQQQSQASASDVGTATHMFLEFCDYSNFLENGIDAECERLVSNRFISEATANILHRDQLALFMQSDLMKEIQSAKRIWREQKFGIFLPFADFTTDPSLSARLHNQKLFVQGSIDLILLTADDRLILVDYKTDHISNREASSASLLARRMAEKHGDQLSCYAKAVQQLFDQKPDQCLIYSTPLGKLIDPAVQA